MKTYSLLLLLLLLWLVGCTPSQEPLPAPSPSDGAYPAPSAPSEEILHLVGEIGLLIHEDARINIEFVPAVADSYLTIFVTEDTNIIYEDGTPTTRENLAVGMPIDVVGSIRGGSPLYATDVVILNPATAVLPEQYPTPEPYPHP